MKKRRLFSVLAMAMVLVLALSALTACGGKNGSAANTSGKQDESSASKDSAAQSEKTAEAKSEPEIKGTTLTVMTWGDYIDWAIPDFEQKYGVKVNLDYYSSEQEAINKIKAGRLGSVDIVFLGSGHEEQAYKQKLLQDIDVTKLENFDNLYLFFRNTVGSPSYKVPFAWGTNSFMYNTDMIKEDITSWKAMWDPKYAGRLSIVDRPELLYWLTNLYLGRDMNDGSDEAFADVKKALQEQIKLNKTFWSTGDDIIQNMSSGEVWIAYAYDGQGRRLMGEGKPIKYVIPDEGTQGWIDNLCLVSDAPNVAAATKFIDYMISEEVQKNVATQVQYSITNQKAAEALDDATKKMLYMDNVDEILPKLKFSKFMGVEWNTKLQEMWTELKGAAGN